LVKIANNYLTQKLQLVN